jgi:multiple sugar transport system permease protein
MKKGRAITRILLHIIAFSIGVLWLLPFLGVFMASIRPFGEILNGWWSLNPFNASLNSFVEAFFDPYLPLSRGILNSLIVTIPSTIIP